MRWEDAAREEGLLHSRARVYLEGNVSSAVNAALAHASGRGASADALALKGLFDRRQLTVAGARKWLVLDDQGSAAVMEACSPCALLIVSLTAPPLPSMHYH